MEKRTRFIFWRCYSIILLLCLFFPAFCKKVKQGEKPEWAKKDIRDYNDADMERLLEQWDEDEEPLPEDELPEHLRKPQPMDFSNIDPSNPEALLKMSKKGKTLMMFASVTNNPTKEELDEVTKLWQTSLMNNHVPVERFVIDETRAIFMFKDGSLAWDAKDYIVEQERCKEVVIENKVYPGKYSEQKSSKKNKLDDEL